MLKTFMNGVSAGGVTSFQVHAAVGRRLDHAVVGADPDAIDVDVRRRDRVDEPERALGAPVRSGVRAYLPIALRQRPSVLRFSSGLICFQLMPPSIVFHSTLLP